MATKATASLEQARRDYAALKARSLESQLQETSVAKFEVEHLSDQRKVGRVYCFLLSRAQISLCDEMHLLLCECTTSTEDL